MNKFYFLLWVRWAIRLTLESLLYALIISLLISLFLYIKQGMAPLDEELISALFAITFFWFPIVWSLTLLLSLFRALKYIFNNCINGFKLELLTCKLDDVINIIGYGDLVKVWRKWFMLLIWLIAGHMIIAVIFTYIFSTYKSVFDWFSIYWLYSFVLTSAYLSFILLTSKCKRVRVVKC